MTHPRAVAEGRVDALPARRFDVIDIAAHTAGHIAYLAPLRAGEPIVCCGDTLADLRTWKNGFR
jgi:glyoxylase-like metal-dependent hydrolase (beta-lactamase superfamily II)